MITDAVRRQFIRDIAEAFATTNFIEDSDAEGLALVWEQNELTAVVAVNTEEAWVSLADASAPVESAEEAIGLLNAIFCDEIVAVAAFEDDVWLSQNLANTSDLHQPPHLVVPLEPRQITRVNRLEIRSWTGALDDSRPYPTKDQ